MARQELGQLSVSWCARWASRHAVRVSHAPGRALGSHTWPGALLLAASVQLCPVNGPTIELGAGTALVSAAACQAQHAGAADGTAQVLATDKADALACTQHTAELHLGMRVAELAWGHRAWPPAVEDWLARACDSSAGCVLAADVVYDASLVGPLLVTLAGLLEGAGYGTTAYIAYTARGEETQAAFLEGIGRAGLEVRLWIPPVVVTQEVLRLSACASACTVRLGAPELGPGQQPTIVEHIMCDEGAESRRAALCSAAGSSSSGGPWPERWWAGTGWSCVLRIQSAR